MGSVITAMLTGSYPNSKTAAAHLATKAIENLHHYSAVGFLDNLADFETKISNIIGRGISFGHENRTEANLDEKEMDRYLELQAFVARRDISNSISQASIADI